MLALNGFPLSAFLFPIPHSLIPHSSQPFPAGGNRCANSAARRERSFQRDPLGRKYRHQVVENGVRYVLVEYAFVSELLQIKLEAFQLHALLRRRVGDGHRAEVGLARLGAHRSELGTDDFHHVIAARELVGKGLKLFAKGGHDSEFEQSDRAGEKRTKCRFTLILATLSGLRKGGSRATWNCSSLRLV